ncbi:MAG: glycyl-radical enzyme activating protein, partial [Clostridia bacterium]|nr:glycyl-radical enzyme activating protein [Clostridia bacterium]
IFDIQRFSVDDGPGIRSVVFFGGCPLSCLWCHNPEGLTYKPQLAFYADKCVDCGACAAVCPTHAHEMKEGKHLFLRDKCVACGACADACLGNALTLYGEETTVEALLPRLLEDKDFYDNSGGGVTLSGGECLAQADFCAALLKALKENGVSSAVDTCGLVPRESLDKVIPYTDVFLYDVKAVNGEVHKRCTGADSRLVLDNLRYLDEKGCKTEIRIPYVPDFNDGEKENMLALLAELKNVVRVRVLPYHKYAGGKYAALDMENTLPEKTPTDEEIALFQREADTLTRK